MQTQSIDLLAMSSDERRKKLAEWKNLCYRDARSKDEIADLIEAARTALPALIAAVEGLEREKEYTVKGDARWCETYEERFEMLRKARDAAVAEAGRLREALKKIADGTQPPDWTDGESPAAGSLATAWREAQSACADIACTALVGGGKDGNQ